MSSYKLKIISGGSAFRKKQSASFSEPERLTDWIKKRLTLFSIPDELSFYIMSPFFLLLFYVLVFFLFYLPSKKENFPVVFFLAVAVTMAASTAYDLWVLRKAHFLRISWGPQNGQLAALALPRFVVFIAGLFVSQYGFSGLKPGLLVLVGGQIIGAVIYGYGYLKEPANLHIVQKKVKTGKNIKAFSFAHISDLHIEKISVREEKILEYLNENPPDCIFLTGDYLNTSYRQDRDSVRALKKFICSLPNKSEVFATMGTPSVDNPEVIRKTLMECRVTVLRDQVVQLKTSSNDIICLAGLDCSHRTELDWRVLESLNGNLKNKNYNILLYHSPELADFIHSLAIDLYLCGHTHGGQVRLPFYGAVLTSSLSGKKYERGEYQLGDGRLYVSSGVGFEGYWAPRLRLFCPPEMTYWVVEGK